MVIKNRPKTMRLLVTKSINGDTSKQIYTLTWSDRLYSNDRFEYIKRLYQSVQHNLIPLWKQNMMGEDDGNIHLSLESLREEHLKAMEELGISQDNQETGYIFTEWNRMLHSAADEIRSKKHLSIRSILDPFKAKDELRTLLLQNENVQIQTVPVVVKSVYRKRGTRKTNQQRIQELQRQIEEYDEANKEFQNTARVSSGRYVPRKYMNTFSKRTELHNVREEHIVDMRKYFKFSGECSVCYEEDMNLYAFKCCKGKSACGPCIANVQNICPFCRQDPEFISKGRYTCYTDTCQLDDDGEWDSLELCQSNCKNIQHSQRFDR